MSFSFLYNNVQIATMTTDKPYGLIENGAVVISAGLIQWVGPEKELPDDFAGLQVKNLEGRLITPALIDCHTHLVYGGSRATEFELRLKGASYEEISRSGGGIISTVTATRNASEEELFSQSLPRFDALLAEGVGTVEIKSGYGLDIETEIKMLRVARKLGKERNVRVKTSFLGAHAIPPEFSGKAEAYIDFVCEDVLPFVHEEKLADTVDGFCENIAFSPKQISRVFDKATALGLPVKLHAEQLSNLGGAALAANFGALSADHLEYLDEAGVQALSKSGTVAVVLPGAFYTLGETQLPPLNSLRKAGVPLAIATDCNPGSSPLTSLLLCMNMACTLFRMTPEEALSGVTRVAAQALGIGNEVGTIEAGKKAELAVWNVDQPAELAYQMGYNPLAEMLVGHGWHR
ncbi:MAG: imidazolonepropionase [SAR324 cluster bacterium]|nr:imidazolonepropionase [SAR324 cluster bacterium]